MYTLFIVAKYSEFPWEQGSDVLYGRFSTRECEYTTKAVVIQVGIPALRFVWIHPTLLQLPIRHLLCYIITDEPEICSTFCWFTYFYWQVRSMMREGNWCQWPWNLEWHGFPWVMCRNEPGDSVLPAKRRCGSGIRTFDPLGLTNEWSTGPELFYLVPWYTVRGCFWKHRDPCIRRPKVFVNNE